MDGMSEEERYEGTLFPFAYIMTLENRLQDYRNRRKQRKAASVHSLSSSSCSSFSRSEQ